MSDESGGTWPEQDAVWDWCAKHGIEADHKQKLELSENATKFRIELQHRLEKAETVAERLDEKLSASLLEQMRLRIELEDTKECWRNDLGIVEYEIERLREALKESVKLQSHYAKLLNQYDGGERISFEDSDAWMERLDALAGGGET